MEFLGEPDFQHGEIPAVGVLLANLGTPEAPTAGALRPYLRQFLSDPRVIELPKLFWQTILNLFVLTRRPKESAKLYASVWTDEGSPLLVIAKQQRAAIAAALSERVGNPVHVALGMRYGEPSIAAAARELKEAGCRKILFFPLYPQYSATTTASTFDALAAELTTWRWVPELRTINGYCDEPAYVAALARSIREVWERDGREPERLLFSFHGIPLRYLENGDPYHCFCHKTARLTAEALGLEEDRWVVAFQSRFGREVWLQPYTDVTVRAMARAGIGSLDVVSPAFSADCLETLEELACLNKEFWEEAGGDGANYRYLPCLNDRPDHVELLTGLVLRHTQGWTVPPAAWDEAAVEAAAEASRERAEELIEAGMVEDAGYGSGG
ncbi:MAG TPA: ferrochelatase [Thermoanaerobaculia bacterium]|nr:ferrochelatase [Thermoanaerobaculia bacterium]